MASDRPRLLDTFCKVGGAAKGYQRAGFHVTGIDVEYQPRYAGDAFLVAEAVDYIRRHGHEYDAIHASPPCQTFCAYRRKGHGVGEGYEDLIEVTRAALRSTGRPYVIENVTGARRELRSPFRLCGSMFRLDVQRHRLFESNWDPGEVPSCDHGIWTPRFPQATNRTNRRKTVEVGVYRIPVKVQQAAMGIDWTDDLNELSNAIPPAYTEWIGRRLITVISQYPRRRFRRLSR
jgi:DNA (cytosine-5)-methyltransferase 1